VAFWTAAFRHAVTHGFAKSYNLNRRWVGEVLLPVVTYVIVRWNDVY